MWIMFPGRGFYSAVQKPEDVATDHLTIRSRCEGDLHNLADLLPGAELIRGGGSDYPVRVKVPRAEWVKAVAAMAGEIDFDNAKNAVAKRQGYARATVYSAVWEVLLQLEDRPPRNRVRGRLTRSLTPFRRV